MSSGPGNYISVGGGSAVGHYAVAHLLDAARRPRPRTWSSTSRGGARIRSEPVPPLRGAGQPGRALRRLLLSQVRAGSGCRSALQRRDRQRVGHGDPRRIRADPNKFVFACTATGVAVEVRAQLGLSALGATTQAYAFDRRRTAGWAPGVCSTFPLSPTTRSARSPRGRRTARTAGATPRTARRSICSTPSRSSGRTRSRTRGARRTTTRCG